MHLTERQPAVSEQVIVEEAPRSFRHLAQLGGTTSLGDCWVALRHLVGQRELIDGDSIRQFESAIARAVGVRFALSFSSGRVGLYSILRAFGVGLDDEVLLQAPTHIVVPNAVRYSGARPVYVDCRPETFNMDPDHAESLVTPRTKVLLVQHTFGIPADMDWAVNFASRHRLILIEDCVHAMGSAYAGQKLGRFGRAAFFSTEETKMISTTMGGVAVTDDQELARSIEEFQSACAWPSRLLASKYVLKLILYHLWTEPHLHRFSRAAYEYLGRRNPLPRPTVPEELRGVRPQNYEQRLSNAQAAIGLRQLHRLQSNLEHRKKISDLYTRYLSSRGLFTPQPSSKADTAFVRYPVWVTDRDAAMRSACGRATLGNWFTSVLEEADSPEYGGYVQGSCVVAEEAARLLVNLPTHPRVTEDDAEAIVASVAPFVRPI